MCATVRLGMCVCVCRCAREAAYASEQRGLAHANVVPSSSSSSSASPRGWLILINNQKQMRPPPRAAPFCALRNDNYLSASPLSFSLLSRLSLWCAPSSPSFGVLIKERSSANFTRLSLLLAIYELSSLMSTFPAGFADTARGNTRGNTHGDHILCLNIHRTLNMLEIYIIKLFSL